MMIHAIYVIPVSWRLMTDRSGEVDLKKCTHHYQQKQKQKQKFTQEEEKVLRGRGELSIP